jgi:hypothetical protein
VAITLDNSASSTGFVSSFETTVSFTIGSGSNRAFLAVLMKYGSGTGDFTSISFNGVSMTALSNVASDRYGNYVRVSSLYLLESSLPTGGAYNFKATSPSDLWNGGCSLFSLAGVSQVAPEATVTAYDNTSNLSSYSNSITTLTNGAWILEAMGVWGSGSLSAFAPASSQTAIHQFPIVSSNPYLGTSYEEKATAGSETNGWSWATSTSNITIHLLASMAPYAAAADTANAPFFGCNF